MAREGIRRVLAKGWCGERELSRRRHHRRDIWLLEESLLLTIQHSLLAILAYGLAAEPPVS